MERYPSGIGKKGFMHKDVVKGFPPWLERVEAPKKDGTVHYPVVRDARALQWLANQNCITPHVWTSRVPRLFYPYAAAWHLDPSQEDADALRAVALGVRGLLTELGLSSHVKTSGSKAFTSSFRSTRRRASTSSHASPAAWPRRSSRATRNASPRFSKAERGGRIYVDVGRNGPGARSPLPTPSARGRARPCPRRAPGTKSRRATSARAPSR